MNETNRRGWLIPLLVVGVVFALWVLWAFLGAPFLKNLLCVDDKACQALGQIGDVFGGVNALFAGLAFGGLVYSIESSRKANNDERLRAHDKEVFEQVCKSYEWAFFTLKGESEEGPPPANRLAWLNAARHLLRAKYLVAEIKTPTFRLLQRENEEYWRFRFYDLLNHESLRGLDYYTITDPGTNKREHHIYYASAAVVADFLVWQGKDPVDDFDVHTAIESPGFKGSYVGRGVERYLVNLFPNFVEAHTKFKERHEK